MASQSPLVAQLGALAVRAQRVGLPHTTEMLCRVREAYLSNKLDLALERATMAQFTALIEVNRKRNDNGRPPYDPARQQLVH